MRHRSAVLVTVLFAFLLAPLAWANVPTTLRGSKGSMIRQNDVATDMGYAFVETATDLPALVDSGAVVPLVGNADYEVLDDVAYPYARPEVRLFIERLAAQYHEGTGEKLVVTSLLRPSDEQPSNAHALSVHPAGIAVDLRVSKRAASQRWLEEVLLSLERKGVLDVTREHRPPHYHVAVFPEAYRSYLEGVIGAEAVALALAPPAPEEETAPEADTLAAVPAMAAAVVLADGDAGEPALPAFVPPLLLAVSALCFRYAKRLKRRAA